MTTAVAVNTDARPYAKFVVPTLLAGLAVSLFWAGIVLRRNTWNRTEAIHYQGDVSNGYGWGQIGKRLGVFNVYDFFVDGQIRSYPNELDYTPLRLAIVTAWARWAETHVPGTRGWSDDYELNRFMLRMNTVAELASSVLVFLLVRHWVNRSRFPSQSPHPSPLPEYRERGWFHLHFSARRIISSPAAHPYPPPTERVLSCPRQLPVRW